MKKKINLYECIKWIFSLHLTPRGKYGNKKKSIIQRQFLYSTKKKPMQREMGPPKEYEICNKNQYQSYSCFGCTRFLLMGLASTNEFGTFFSSSLIFPLFTNFFFLSELKTFEFFPLLKYVTKCVPFYCTFFFTSNWVWLIVFFTG